MNGQELCYTNILGYSLDKKLSITTNIVLFARNPSVKAYCREEPH